ncbi:MAG: hypothetical protein V3V00_07445 [Saprospiraceae bacterium]
MKKLLLVLIVSFCTIGIVSSQTHMHFGLLSGSNKLETFTPKDFSHSGWRIGIDQQILGKGIYLLGGLHYVRFNEEARNGTNFFETSPAIQILKPRAGIGITPFALTDLFKIRLKGLVSYNYFLAFKGETVTFETEKIKSGYLNLDLGVGVTVGFITVDIEYELGLDGTIKDLDDSKFRFLSVSAGLMF